jgi:putative membrane protein
MRGWFVTAASLAALACAGSALAQPVLSTANRPTQTPTDAVSYVDEAFAADAFEVTSSKLALSRSKDAAVRDLAERMIDSGTMTTNALLAAAEEANVPPPSSPSGDKVKGAMMDALTQTTGKDFDDTYIAQQRRIQQESLALHQRYAADGDNDILRDYAVDTAARAADQLDDVNNLPRR